MKCPNCGHDNLDGVKFCNECAAELKSELIYPKCGQKNPEGSKFFNECAQPLGITQQVTQSVQAPLSIPTSFASSRYQAKKFLGEGGKKKVYLAHDTILDREVALYLIKN